MSGGDWDYFYYRLQEVAERLIQENTLGNIYERDDEEITVTDPVPERLRFGQHLLKCAAAMRAIEWVDSGDSSTGDVEAIQEVFNEINPSV